MKKFKIVKRQRGGSTASTSTSTDKKKIRLAKRPQKHKSGLPQTKEKVPEDDDEDELIQEEEGEEEEVEEGVQGEKLEAEEVGDEEFLKRYQLGHVEGSKGAFGVDFVQELLINLIAPSADEEAVTWCKWLMSSGQDPQAALTVLLNETETHSICGKDLDKNSWQYQCLTCQNDDTCVMCAECFSDSNHKGHKVQRIKVSSGTCDCGDPESWKPSGFCSKHRGPGEQVGIMSTIPAELLTPITTTLAGMLDVILSGLGQFNDIYAYPRDQAPETRLSNTWAVMMFNDEDHSFEDVINRLVTAMPITQTRADNIALRVDALGQCVADVGTKKECEKVVKSLTSKKPPLICTVTDAVNLVQEERIGAVLDFLIELCDGSDALRKLCGSILALPLGETNFDKKPATATTTATSTTTNKDKRTDLVQTRLDILFSCYESVSPNVRDSFGNWVLSLLKDHSFKKDMGIGYAKWYPYLLDRYYHLLETDNTLLEHTVQIFTMRDTAYNLAVEHNLVGVILRTLLSELDRNSTKNENDNKVLDIYKFQEVQIEPIIRDLGYLLAAGNTAHLITQHTALYQDFVALHELGQCIQPNLRELNAHVEMDQDTYWMRALNYNNDIMHQHDIVVRQLSETELQFTEAMVFTDLQCWLNKNQLDFYEVKDKAIVAPPDVVTEGVSFHIPLHRLYSCIIQHATKKKADKYLQARQIPNVELALSILEHPLRIFVLVAQVFAGLWVRNGYGLLNQTICYREGLKLQNIPILDKEFKMLGYARDLFLVQTLAMVIPIPHFMEVLVNRFELESFFSASPDLSETPLYDPAKLLSVAEQFLELLIILVTHRDFVSDISDEDITRDIVVHALFLLGSCTYSKLMNNLGTSNSERCSPYFEKVLKEVAHFREPQGVDQGKYELKEEYYAKFNRFYWDYTRREREIADELYEKKKGSPQPPALPLLRSQYADLNEILVSEKLNDITFFSLLHSVNETPKSHSIALLVRTLHLLQLQIMEVWEHTTKENVSKYLARITAVREVTVPATSPESSSSSTSSSIFSLLMQIRTKYPQLNDNVMWILEKLFAIDPSLKDSFAATVNVEEEVKNKRKEMQEAARKKLLLQFTNQQNEFAKTLENVHMDDEDDPKDEEAVCILCRESSPLYCESKPLGAIMSIVESKIITGKSVKVVKCCGHIIHVDCCCKYWSSLKEKRSRGIEFEGIGILSLEDGEFACPICKTVSEFVVPIVALRGQAQITIPATLSIPDQPSELLAGIEVNESYDEDRPAVISTLQLYLDKISPTTNSSAASSLCIGTACHIEFASRSTANSISAIVKEKDIQNLTFLINSTRTAVAGFSRGHERVVMKLSPSLGMDIIGELVTLSAKVPVVDNALFATKFASLFRALFFVGVAQCLVLDIDSSRSASSSLPAGSLPVSPGSPSPASSSSSSKVTKFVEPNKTASITPGRAVSLFSDTFLNRLCELAKVHRSSGLENRLLSLHTFTRTAAIVYSALFSVPLPPISDLQNEFFTLLTFLNFPTTLLQSFPSQFESFVLDLLASKSKVPSMNPPTPFSLINLPDSFYSFGEGPHAQVVCKKCHNNLSTSRTASHKINAAVCLVCGDYVCPNSACCGKEVTTHSAECCGDFGAFLSLDGQGVVLLVFKGITGAYTATPYLDPHGEEDLNLARGLPLNLDLGRVEHLREIVVSHTISSKILGKTYRRNEM